MQIDFPFAKLLKFEQRPRPLNTRGSRVDRKLEEKEIAVFAVKTRLSPTQGVRKSLCKYKKLKLKLL